MVPNIPELMVCLDLDRYSAYHAGQDPWHVSTMQSRTMVTTAHKAMLANFGWLAVMWGILIAIWSTVAMPLMPDLTGLPAVVSIILNVGHIIGVVLLLAGIIFIARESVLEVIELPTIISHVLSYARIVAVGLSSVAIAMVVNFMSIDDVHRAPAREPFSCR